MIAIDNINKVIADLRQDIEIEKNCRRLSTLVVSGPTSSEVKVKYKMKNFKIISLNIFRIHQMAT
jgi:hypothetical protein